MARTSEPPGWTSQFREIIMEISTDLHDLRDLPLTDLVLDPADYAQAQQLGASLRAGGSNGLVYPSIRHAGGQCIGLFYPDGASQPIQGRHLDYHWDGQGVDFVRDASSGAVFRIIQT